MKIIFLRVSNEKQLRTRLVCNSKKTKRNKIISRDILRNVTVKLVLLRQLSSVDKVEKLRYDQISEGSALKLCTKRQHFELCVHGIDLQFINFTFFNV
jgi:hypothetical protein